MKKGKPTCGDCVFLRNHCQEHEECVNTIHDGECMTILLRTREACRMFEPRREHFVCGNCRMFQGSDSLCIRLDLDWYPGEDSIACNLFNPF